jgi:hypothetical protein
LEFDNVSESFVLEAVCGELVQQRRRGFFAFEPVIALDEGQNRESVVGAPAVGRRPYV